MTLSVTPWMSTQGGSLHTHKNMLVGGSSSSSSLSELASASTQHRSSRHTRIPARTSIDARSSSVPECSGREQVACRELSGEQTHDMPAIRRELRRTRALVSRGRRPSQPDSPPFDRVVREWKVRDWRHDRIGNVSNRIHYKGGEGGGGGPGGLNFWGPKQASPAFA